MNYIWLLVSYLFGSLPFSLIIGKLFLNVDVREHGSKNPGATNAIRVLGRKWGVPVFFLDVLKGGIPVLIVMLGVFDGMFHPLYYGLMAMMGHVYPLFLKFKGGKAVATSFGVFLFYAPVLGIIAGLTFYLTLKLYGYVSVSSTLAAASLLIAAWLVYIFGPLEGPLVAWFSAGGQLALPIVGTTGATVIFIRHRKNYERLRNKTEPHIKSFQKKKA